MSEVTTNGQLRACVLVQKLLLPTPDPWPLTLGELGFTVFPLRSHSLRFPHLGPYTLTPLPPGPGSSGPPARSLSCPSAQHKFMRPCVLNDNLHVKRAHLCLYYSFASVYVKWFQQFGNVLIQVLLNTRHNRQIVNSACPPAFLFWFVSLFLGVFLCLTSRYMTQVLKASGRSASTHPNKFHEDPLPFWWPHVPSVMPHFCHWQNLPNKHSRGLGNKNK